MHVENLSRWTILTAPSGNNADQAIARLKALALKANQDGDKAKAREYIIQMKVGLVTSSNA